jgi:PAS domain S-box-containing protein
MKKCSILVVEDEALIAANLVHTLTSLGHMVHGPVATGEDAIRSVKTQKPDLVLMDIQLIGAMDGIETAEKIRAIADIPVVYLTAHTDDLRLKQAQLTEPYGYIVKPAHGRELNATIEMALYKHALDRKLKESEERYRSLFDRSLDCVYLTDFAGNFIDANQSALTLLGYTRNEIASLNFASMLTTEQISTALKVNQEIIATGGQEKSSEYRVRCRDGTYVDVESTASLVYQQGKPYAVQGIARDITDRKMAEEALRAANRNLNLLSSITRHDITNQLTVLRGFLKILKKKQPDPSLDEYFQKIAGAAERIAAMIQFTKTYENIGVKAPAWKDARTLVDTAAKDVVLSHVRLENDLPPGTEVFADPLVVRVFYNLMDNAVRYGGKITTIRFSVLESGDDHLIVCEDDGEGVPADEKEKIFDRGFGKNTGLGLFLAREILSITGITIRETGEPGKGVRFEMVVPKGAWRMTGNGA